MDNGKSLNISCKEENEAFQQFSILFFKENDHHLKAKSLHMFLQSHLQQFNCIQVEILKTDVFTDLISEISNLCCIFLTNPSKSVNKPYAIQKISNNSCYLTNNLESASLCFEILLVCLKSSCETKELVVLIKTSLKILSLGYTHCKESEIIYGNQLEQFANQLGEIFKHIENLQMIVLQKLDQLMNVKDFDDSSYIRNIISEFRNLCQVVSSLDADVAFQLWTMYLRIVTDYDKYLHQCCDVELALIYLVSKNIEILEMCKFNLDKNSEEDEELSTKLGFYLDSLMKMLNVVKNKEGITEFRLFLITLIDFLISCYSPLALEKDVLGTTKQILIKNTYPLLSHIYSDEVFLTSFLLSNLQESKSFQTAFNLLKVCGLQYLKSTALQNKVLEKLFACFLTNTPEDDMNLVNSNVPLCTISKNNSTELIVLYQFTYERVSDILKLSSDLDIKNLQNTIMDCIISSSDAVFLLICDLWIYRLRCSNVEFLKDQCYFVLQNYLIKDGNNNTRINIMFKRMWKFLPQYEKDILNQQFSVLKFINNEKEVKHIHSVANFTLIENELFSNLEDKIQLLMAKMKEPFSNDVHNLVQKACACLELCALFVNFLDCTQTVQFIELASQLFKTEIYEIQIATLTFLKALGRKSLPEHILEFGKVVTQLAELFSLTIHSKNYIVKYEALNTFSYFAKCTPHVKIIQQTVKRDSNLKLAVKSFITAVPSNGFLTEKERAENLQKQVTMLNNVKVDILDESKQILQNIISKIT